jgi:hypothetical protein
MLSLAVAAAPDYHGLKLGLARNDAIELVIDTGDCSEFTLVNMIVCRNYHGQAALMHFSENRLDELTIKRNSDALLLILPTKTRYCVPPLALPRLKPAHYSVVIILRRSYLSGVKSVNGGHVLLKVACTRPDCASLESLRQDN